MDCNKIGFATPTLARDFRDEVRKQKISDNRKSLRKLRPYFCGRCGLYHLTSQNKAAARRHQKHQRAKQSKGDRS